MYSSRMHTAHSLLCEGFLSGQVSMTDILGQTPLTENWDPLDRDPQTATPWAEMKAPK